MHIEKEKSMSSKRKHGKNAPLHGEQPREKLPKARKTKDKAIRAVRQPDLFNLSSNDENVTPPIDKIKSSLTLTS